MSMHVVVDNIHFPSLIVSTMLSGSLYLMMIHLIELINEHLERDQFVNKRLSFCLSSPLSNSNNLRLVSRLRRRCTTNELASEETQWNTSVNGVLLLFLSSFIILL